MTEPLIQHVSDTAFMVAHHRAVESARPDALFSDPLAARLAGERGKAIAEGLSTSRMTGWTLAIRTRLIDDLIRLAIDKGVDTIINLGAGLDTRPYRLDLPASLTWVEVDYPAVIAFKQERLTAEVPRCRLERVGLDLADGPARRQLLARVDARSQRALCLTEGVVPYLDLAEAGALADDLRALAHLESWIVDYISPAAIAYRKRTGVAHEMREAPFKFEPPDWYAFFASHGWKCREMRYLTAESEKHGRRPPLPFLLRAIMTLLRPFATPEKRLGFQSFAGYGVLEPGPR